MNLNEKLKWLKRSAKRKVTISISTVITFMMLGMFVSQTSYSTVSNNNIAYQNRESNDRSANVWVQNEFKPILHNEEVTVGDSNVYGELEEKVGQYNDTFDDTNTNVRLVKKTINKDGSIDWTLSFFSDRDSSKHDSYYGSYIGGIKASGYSWRKPFYSLNNAHFGFAFTKDYKLSGDITVNAWNKNGIQIVTNKIIHHGDTPSNMDPKLKITKANWGDDQNSTQENIFLDNSSSTKLRFNSLGLNENTKYGWGLFSGNIHNTTVELPGYYDGFDFTHGYSFETSSDQIRIEFSFKTAPSGENGGGHLV